MMILNWRDPRVELPKDDQVVWVLMRHWKNEPGQSFEIYCGVYADYAEHNKETGYDCKNRVENNDYIGQGSSSWEFPREDHEFGGCNHVYAWLPLQELDTPKFGDDP